MSITYTPSGFITTSSTPAFQNWNSRSPSEFVFVQSSAALIFPFFEDIMFKDIIGTPEGTPYSQFRILASKSYFGSTSGVDWLNISSIFFSDLILSIPKIMAITSNGNSDSITLWLNNIALLNVGLHEAHLNYIIEGLSAGTWKEISSYTHVVKLSVYETEQITWTPNNFIMNHFQGAPNASQSIVMNGPAWKVTSNYNFILESTDVDVTITTLSDAVGIRYVAEGSGEKTIKVKAGAFYDEPIALYPGVHSSRLHVTTGVSTFVGQINFTINVLAPADFVVSPMDLFFEAAIGGEEPEPIEVNVFAENVYTISAPLWLNVTPLVLSSAGIFTKLAVVPIPSANLAAGAYTDTIVLTSMVAGEPITISINVTYILSEFVALPYSQSGYNFTKDPVFIDFFTTHPDTYFNVRMNVEVFDWHFQSSGSKNILVPFKIALFQKRQKENIGERIEKMLFKYLEPNTGANHQYNAANVVIEIEEKTYPQNELVRETTLIPLKFLSGITPKNKLRNTAILEVSNNVKRITSKSFDYLNLMVDPLIEVPIEFFVNEELVGNYSIISQTATYKETINFENYNLKPGDVFEVKIYADIFKIKSVSKKYIVFPDGEYSNMIIWEDDYKMLQSYEFLGKHSIKQDYTFINFSKKKNLIEYIKNVDTRKTLKLTINTGVVPKSDIIYVDNIIRAKRLWVFANNELVELNSETKSLIYDDVDRELNYFDLEFTINKKHNEESNSF